MKKHLLILLAAALPAVAQAQTPPEWAELPLHLDGRMMIYDFDSSQPFTLPDSLTAVKVAYVARHGARYMTSEKKFRALEAYLSDAARTGALTADGEAMLDLLKRISEVSEGQWGDLSAVGSEEQRLLAGELKRMLPQLLSDARAEAQSTYVPRVIETMYDYCYTLADPGVEANKKYIPSGVSVSTAEGHQFDRELRFFMIDSAFREYQKNGPWRPVYEDYESTNVPLKPLARLVDEKRFRATPEADARALVMEEYNTLSSLRAMGMGYPSTRWFSVEEYEACWRVSNLDQYLQRAISPVATLPGAIAAPLLDSVVAGLDDKRPEAPQLVLKFGHAETLIPFVSLLGLPGYDALPLDWDKLASGWKNYEIAPLGGNILIILARSASGREYVSIRLNGRNVAAAPGFPLWSPWPEARSRWLERAAAITPAETGANQ